MRVKLLTHHHYRGVAGLSAVYDGGISILMGKRELVALLSLSS